MRIISETIPSVRSISIGLWIDTGSRDEPKGFEGVSHFIEHMVFKGTDTRSPLDIVSYIESVGGILNAFTSRENTCFLAKVIDLQLPRAVEILADLAFNARFDEADIDKEKKIVIDEIHEVDDTPSDLVHDIFAESIYGEHALGRPILGTQDSVSGLTREGILGYRDRKYIRKKMMVVVSGNMKHEELVELVKRYFPKTPANDIAIEPRVAPKFISGLTVKTQKTNQTHICIGAPAVGFGSGQRPALLLLNSIIGGGMSSRLFQRIREELGMAYTVFSYIDFFRDSSVIGAYLNTDKKYTAQVILNTFDELEKLSNSDLTLQEIDSAKEQLKGSLVLGLENTSHRMNRLAKHELLIDRYIGVDETIEEIDKVTIEQVRLLARELFKPDNYQVTVLGPMTKSGIEKQITR